MIKAIALSLLAGAGLVGCVSADYDNYTALGGAEAVESGTVLFYRGHSPQAKLADAYLGAGKGYFLSLDEDQYASVEVPVGFNEFKVRAQGSVAFKTQIKVNVGETVCVETRPNHEELEWLVLPFVNALIPSFVLEETPCPNTAAFDELAAI